MHQPVAEPEPQPAAPPEDKTPTNWRVIGVFHDMEIGFGKDVPSLTEAVAQVRSIIENGFWCEQDNAVTIIPGSQFSTLTIRPAVDPPPTDLLPCPRCRGLGAIELTEFDSRRDAIEAILPKLRRQLDRASGLGIDVRAEVGHYHNASGSLYDADGRAIPRAIANWALLQLITLLDGATENPNE